MALLPRFGGELPQFSPAPLINFRVIQLDTHLRFLVLSTHLTQALRTVLVEWPTIVGVRTVELSGRICRFVVELVTGDVRLSFMHNFGLQHEMMLSDIYRSDL